MKKTLTLLFVLTAILNGYSQLSKTHYIPPITSANSLKPSSGAASSSDPDINQYIYISTPSTTPVTVTITPIGSVPITNIITNATPWIYTISTPENILNGSTFKNGVLSPAKYGFDNQLFVDYSLTGTVQKNRGFLIESNDSVYANLRVQSRVSGTTPSASQAGSLVAKGLNAYGKEFRIGGFENKSIMNSSTYGSLVNFASFIATEDNTTVTIDLPRALIGATAFYNGTQYNGPFTVTLNKNESYVFAIQNTSSTTFESNLILGGHITSDRNIVVNCGSIAGNSQIKGEGLSNSIAYNDAGKDYGFDQIVSAEKTGKEYIFVGGAGMIQTAKAYDLERVIIIANANGTQVFKNGSTTPITTLNAGEYYVFNGNDFIGSSGTGYNLYITTSENVFAYQCIAGKNDASNQNMFFVPPLNCATPSVVNNIPFIEQAGTVTYPNITLNIVTEATATDATPIIIINGSSVQLNGTNCLRSAVTGKPGFYSYTYPSQGGISLAGNVSISAPRQVYVSYYGSNSNATYGGYFSGFDTKPNIVVTSPTAGTICIDNTVLSTSALPVDLIQWQYRVTLENTPVDIFSATGNSYTPTSIVSGGKGPGYYSVVKISACNNSSSDPIAVSECDGLGIKHINTDSKFVLYPNPTTGILNIESNIEDTFTVVNQLGQVVKTLKVNVGTNKVDLENLVDGIYYLKNKSAENQVVKKIIKK